MKDFVQLKQIEDVLDKGRAVKHSKLSQLTEEVITDPAKVGSWWLVVGGNVDGFIWIGWGGICQEADVHEWDGICQEADVHEWDGIYQEADVHV